MSFSAYICAMYMESMLSDEHFFKSVVLQMTFVLYIYAHVLIQVSFQLVPHIQSQSLLN